MDKLLVLAVNGTGLRGLAYDKTQGRSNRQCILLFDFSDSDQLESFLDFIRNNASRILFIHLAPPCGTASRARERRISSFRRRGLKEPKPLRSDMRPDGNPGLSGRDKLKTETANILYSAVQAIVDTALEYNIKLAVENPANILMWKTSFLQALMERPDFFRILFHSCAHGGTRDKLTCFFTNAEFLRPLELRCDGTHKHDSWRPTVKNNKAFFPTHLEAAYPVLLCERMASLFYTFAMECGAVVYKNLPESAGITTRSLNRVVLGAHPRGKHVAPLVSEYGLYYNAIFPAQHSNDVGKLLAAFPKGSSIQSRSLVKWGMVRIAMDKQSNKPFLHERQADLTSALQCVRKTNYIVSNSVVQQDDHIVEKVVIRVPREPLDFLHRAILAGHPRSHAISLPVELQNVVDWNRTGSALELHSKRIDFVKKWTKRAGELSGANAELVKDSPKHLREILSNKRLALWKDMLEHYNYPDLELIDNMARGFPLLGWMPCSHVFPQDLRPPSLDAETLSGMCKGLNARVKAKVMADNDPAIEAAT